MLRKTIVLTSFLLFLYSMPALAAVKVEWDTTTGWNDVNNDLLWKSSFITNGDWSLGSNLSFFLKDQVLITQADRQWRGILDRCYFQFETDPIRLKLGRQGVSWGIGWFFRPTDLITPLTPLAEEETRPGKDLAVLRWSTSPLTATDLIVGNQLFAARSEWRIGGTNLRLLGVCQPEYINAVGFDVQGGLAGFYGEGAYRWAATSGFDQGRFEGLIGWRKIIGSGCQLSIEYFRNDLSKSGPELADLLLQNLNRELIYANQNYLAVGLQVPLDQLTTFAITGISNPGDGGAILEGIADFQLTDNLEVRGALMTVTGPDGTEFCTMGQGARVGVTVEVKYFF
jgi:hypothetical protein